MSTKTKKKPTLPKGLPKLPPVPKGYDAWELCGWGGLKMEADGTPWGCACKPSHNWNVENQTDCDALGYDTLFYIRAIKCPAPAKKQPKAKAVNSAHILNRSANQAARAAVKEIEAMSGQSVELSDCVKLVNVFASAIESLGIILKRKGAK